MFKYTLNALWAMSNLDSEKWTPEDVLRNKMLIEGCPPSWGEFNQIMKRLHDSGSVELALSTEPVDDYCLLITLDKSDVPARLVPVYRLTGQGYKEIQQARRLLQVHHDTNTERCEETE